MVPVYNRLPRNKMDGEKACFLLYNKILSRTMGPDSQKTGGEAPPAAFLTDSLCMSARILLQSRRNNCRSPLREARAFFSQTFLANASLGYIRGLL